jgi:predicted nucleic-acid-binding protein
MKFELNSQDKIQKFVIIFSKVKLFSDNITLYFKEKALYIQGMDNTQSSMYEINFMKEWFSLYDADKIDNEGTISFSTKTFTNVLKCVEKTTSYIKLQATEDRIEFEIHTDEGKYSKLFKIPKYTVEHMLLDVPTVYSPVEVIFKTDILKKYLSEQATFGDTIKIHCDDSNIKFKVESTELDMNTSIDVDTVEMYAIEEDTTVEIQYNLVMLSKFMEFSKLSSKTHLYISEDMPLKLIYNLDEQKEEEEEKVQNFISLYMAPMMDD